MKGLGAETRVLNTATKPWLDRDPPGNHCPAPFGKAHSESTQKSSWAREQSLTEQVSNDPGRLPGGEALCSGTVYTQLQQRVIPTSYPTRTGTRRKEGRTTSEDWFLLAFSVLQWLVLAHGRFIKADNSTESLRIDSTVTARRVTWPRQYLSK